jgi:hypothetical protein
MLDSGFLDTIFVVSAFILTNDLIREDNDYLCPKAKVYLPTVYTPKL